MIVNAFRVMKFTAQNFWRNFWLSVITISMLVLTLLTVNVLLILQVVGSQVTTYVQDRIEVSVYFKSETDVARAVGAAEYLRGFAQVKDVEVVSAQDALKRFEERHKKDASVLASIGEIGENPFGPTMVVRAQSVEDFPFILELLDNPRFSEDIREKDFSDYKILIDRIQTISDQLAWFGLILSVIFLVIALLIVFNTVRMSIYIHSSEISIMKLVGASNWFVRAPFLGEALVYSLLATLIVLGLVLGALPALQGWLDLYFTDGAISVQPFIYNNGLMIFGSQFLALAFINSLSTLIAMRKYLRA